MPIILEQAKKTNNQLSQMYLKKVAFSSVQANNKQGGANMEIGLISTRISNWLTN